MGTLYICATPIGNLEDVSIRLLKTLRSVDFIACEDTRQSVKLLQRYKINKQLISYHQYSRREKEEYILKRLEQGESAALLSDAGMPCISDPGESLIKRAIEREINIDIIPGPSAGISALAISGLDARQFTFYGFAPRKAAERRAFLESMQKQTITCILYEAPHRLNQLLEDAEAVLGSDRKIVVVRELTKKYQEIFRGTMEQGRAYFQKHQPRGEFCVLIGGQENQDDKEVDIEQILHEVDALIAEGIDKKEAFKMKAREYKIKKSIIYKAYVQKEHN